MRWNPSLMLDPHLLGIPLWNSTGNKQKNFYNIQYFSVKGPSQFSILCHRNQKIYHPPSYSSSPPPLMPSPPYMGKNLHPLLRTLENPNPPLNKGGVPTMIGIWLLGDSRVSHLARKWGAGGISPIWKFLEKSPHVYQKNFGCWSHMKVLLYTKLMLLIVCWYLAPCLRCSVKVRLRQPK